MCNTRTPRRGGIYDLGGFAGVFVQKRLVGFVKDVGICLTGIPRPQNQTKMTHAYFPPLMSCCGMTTCCCWKAQFAAERHDCRHAFLNHTDHAVGADVRRADKADLFRRARFTNLSSTLRARCHGSLIWVLSSPPENVPAPPLPYCTFDSRSSTPWCRLQVSLVRWRPSLPRSSTMGPRPICARGGP